MNGWMNVEWTSRLISIGKNHIHLILLALCGMPNTNAQRFYHWKLFNYKETKDSLLAS